MAQVFDRSEEDLGNIVKLEHLNFHVPDQRLATLFYVTGLGFTRDPYLMTSIDNMWINVGRSQFHLPTGNPTRLRGYTALVVPDLAELVKRLTNVRRHLADTEFSFTERAGYVEATCPWGNRFRLYAPAEQFGPVTLAIPFLALDAPVGSSKKIAKFYKTMFGATATTGSDDEGKFARVSVGAGQYFMFRETDKELPAFDGHHLQVYLADFSGPHRKLSERNLIAEESDQHQYRVMDIVDLDNGEKVLTLEHELRSMRHPLYERPLVNRNPAQTNRNYAPGHDEAAWALVEA